jgi:hypothetical protein
MSFPSTSDIQLSPEQSSILGKLKAYSNYASFLPRPDSYIPKDRQISLFDFMKLIFSALGNRDLFDSLLRQFLNSILNPATNLLEKKVIYALATAFDKQNKILSNETLPNGKFKYSSDGGLNPSNQVFLETEALPYFNLAKDTLLAELMALIFGPTTNIQKFNPTFTPTQAAEYAACGGSLYTISNLPNQGVGDIEYNRAQLLQQITNGGVVFEISCQQLVIKLPEVYTETLFPGGVSVIAGDGTTGSKSNFSPDTTIQLLENYVQNEVARQNIPDNQSSASKTFRENFIQKLLNLITFSIMKQLTVVFDRIEKVGSPIQISNGPLTNAVIDIATFYSTNAVSGTLNQFITTPVSRTDLENSIKTSPCDVYNAGMQLKTGQNNNTEANQYIIFAKTLINAILGILLSILIRRLIKEVKSLLAKVIAKKSQDLAIRLAKKRLAIYEAYFNAEKEKIEKQAKLASALVKLADVIKSF